MNSTNKTKPKRIRSLLEMLEGLEMLCYALAGVAVLGFAIYWAGRAALSKGGPLLLALLAGMLLAALGLSVRDARRRQWSPVSIGVVVVWAASVLALIIW